MEKLWQAKLEVDLESIEYNINKIKNICGKDVKVMPVIKDDGYRTGLNTRIDFLGKCNIEIIGVAILDEAIKMRELRI